MLSCMQWQKRQIVIRLEPLNGEEPEKCEDDIQRELLGPCAVPDAPDPAGLTPQGEENTPKHVDFTLRRLRSSYLHPAP
jgi:hypothetical protein